MVGIGLVLVVVAAIGSGILTVDRLSFPLSFFLDGFWECCWVIFVFSKEGFVKAVTLLVQPFEESGNDDSIVALNWLSL